MTNLKVPRKYQLEAMVQWLLVSIAYLPMWLLTFFPMAFIVAYTAKKTTNCYGESTKAHDKKYVDQGSSGIWWYMSSPLKFVDGWNNLEDGTLGEPSGKHSARCKGKEASFWNQYSWLCRNPYNKGKRTSEFFSCFVDNCDIEYWGVKTLSDKDNNPITKGWYFVRAQDRTNKKTYYGYRSVKLLNSKSVRVIQIGYKIKPEHALEIQDIDDKDKAFTLRFQLSSQID